MLVDITSYGVLGVRITIVSKFLGFQEAAWVDYDTSSEYGERCLYRASNKLSARYY